VWHTPLLKIIFSIDNLEEHLWKAQPQLVRKACGRMWYVSFQWILHAQIEILKAFIEKNSIQWTSKSLKFIYWCNRKQGLFSHFSMDASCTISEVKWVMKRSMCYKMGHPIPLRCVECTSTYSCHCWQQPCTLAPPSNYLSPKTPPKTWLRILLR